MMNFMILDIILSNLILFSIWMCLTTTNPLKMAVKMAVSSMYLMMMMYLTSGQTWYSGTFLLIFIGGIIIMFLILTSVSPNENMKKPKISASITILMLASIYAISKISLQSQRDLIHSKWFLSSEHVNVMYMIIMIFYLTVFNEILKKKDSTMRSLQCY